MSCQIFGYISKKNGYLNICSEEKAKLMRQINDQVGDKSAQLNQFLSALQINQLHLNNFDYLKLPKQLLECCASLSVRQSLLKQEIPETMKSIVNVSVQTKSILDEIEETIEVEEKEYRKQNSNNGHHTDDSLSDSSSSSEDEVPSSIFARKKKLKEISKKYDLLLNNYTEANTSNTALHEAFSSIVKNLQILCLPLPELTAQLPQIDTQIDNANSKEIRDKLVSLLDKVEEMKTQRDELLKRLQRAIQEDDLTKTIASKQNDIEVPASFFQEQLKKHEQLITYLNQNLQAQDNILRALADANAAFATDRKKIIDATQQRNAFIDNLVFSYQSVSELIEKANKGIAFFSNLSSSLRSLLNEVNQFCQSSKQEREAKKRLVERFNPAMNPKVTNPLNMVSNQIRMPSLNDNPAPIDIDKINISSITNERPKLKDYLPMMKPQSWGNNKAKNQGPPVVDRTSFNSGYTNPKSVPNTQLDQSRQPNTNLQYQQPQVASLPASAFSSPSYQTQVQAPQNSLVNPDAYQRFKPTQIPQYPVAQESTPNSSVSANLNYNPGQIQGVNQNINHSFQYSMMTQAPQYSAPDIYKQTLIQQRLKQQQEQAQEQAQQQKISEQKRIDQQLKEFEAKKLQLEQQEQQLKFQQQQFLLQQQRHQEFLLEQEKVRMRNLQQPSQQFLNPVSHLSNPQGVQLNQQVKMLVLQPQNPTGVQPRQEIANKFFNNSQLSANQPNSTAFYNQNATNGSPIFTNQSFTHADNKSNFPLPPTLSSESNLSSIKPDSVYKPGYYNYNQLKIEPQTNANIVTTPHNQAVFANPANNFKLPQQQQPINSNLNQNQKNLTINNTIPPLNNLAAKPSAIDDLLGLFENNSLLNSAQILFPTSQPIKSENDILAANLPQIKPIELNNSNNLPEYEQPGFIDPVNYDLTGSIEIQATLDSKVNSSNKLNFLNNPCKLERFVNEVQKLEGHVGALCNKTLASGCTLLEKEWKELNDYQDKNTAHMTISVARCYPNLNRFQDLLPFDQTRVVLNTRGSDDYINATLIGQLSTDSIDNTISKVAVKQPNFITCQAPILSNNADVFNFWSMIVQQQIELVVCLSRDTEMTAGTSESNKLSSYWPRTKETPFQINSFKIVLQAVKETEHSTRRILLVSNLADSTQITRTVVLIQLNTNQGPGSLSNPVRLSQASGIGLNEMPDNLAGFLRFVKECEHFYTHEQRNAANPILVHCMNGVSRSAVFILIYTLIQIVDASCNDEQSLPKTSISDSLIRAVKLMRLKRKYMIQSVYHLKYSYNAILYYLKDILFKEGVLTNSTFNNEINKVEITAKEFDSSILKDNSLLSIQSSNEGVLKEHQNAESIESPSVTVTTAQFPIEVSEPPKVNCSIIDLYDPNNFSLDLTADSAKRKQKITKKDFLNGSSVNSSISPSLSIANNNVDQEKDYFTSLDPLRKQ